MKRAFPQEVGGQLTTRWCALKLSCARGWKPSCAGCQEPRNRHPV